MPSAPVGTVKSNLAGRPKEVKEYVSKHGRLPPRSGANWTLDAIEQELAWRRWFPTVDVDWTRSLSDEDTQILHDACCSFIEENMSIRFPGKGKQPLKLRDAQREVLWSWIKHRRNVCLKARQIGFSTLAAAYVLWSAFGYPDRFIVMLSRTERESIKLLAKTKYMHKYLPQWVYAKGPQVLDKAKQVMTFDNDSVIESLPSANDPARGESVFLVIVDEWAFLPNADDAWASIEPIADLGGRVIGISTANGEGNFYHRLWLESQTGENGFAGVFFPWSAVEARDEEWIADKRRSMQPWQVAQEYPSTPEEAFVGSGNPVFDLENLRRFKTRLPDVGEFTIVAENGRHSVTFIEGGPFHVWELPNEVDRYSYVVGADIAQGLEHGDATVAWVMCVQTNRPVACWYGKIDPDIFGSQVLPAIGWFYRNAVVAPEVNNHGISVLKGLQRAKYKRIYRRRSFSKRKDTPLESLGWLTTQSSKPLLVDELQMFLRETDDLPHDRTMAELRQFVRAGNGKMGGSPHDDTVIALGIAVQARKYAITEHIDGGHDARKIPGSYAWYEAKLDKARGKDRGLLGLR